MQSSWVLLHWNTFASLLVIFSSVLSGPQSLFQEQERVRASQNDVQRCWQCFWCRLVQYPTLYAGRVPVTGSGMRTGANSFRFLTKEGEEDLQKDFILGNTQSAYAICSKSLQWMEDSTRRCSGRSLSLKQWPKELNQFLQEFPELLTLEVQSMIFDLSDIVYIYHPGQRS